jgi:hypothetical protein
LSWVLRSGRSRPAMPGTSSLHLFSGLRKWQPSDACEKIS